jgi:hypothetical protein
MDGDHIIRLKKRPLHRRFINSYRIWRMHLGVWASLCSAWVIATS